MTHTHYTPDKLTLTVALVAIAVAVISIYVNVALVLQPEGRLKCSDFGSYSDALDAYNNGATYLDGDHDGKPCNSLYNESHHSKK